MPSYTIFLIIVLPRIAALEMCYNANMLNWWTPWALTQSLSNIFPKHMVRTEDSLRNSSYKSVCGCIHTCLVVANSWLWQTHWLQPASLLCPWDFPGKNIGVGCHFLLQGIFLIQGSNLCLLSLLHWQADTLPLHHLGSPVIGQLQRGEWKS